MSTRLDQRLVRKLVDKTGKRLKYVREQISKRANRQGVTGEAALILYYVGGITTAVAQPLFEAPEEPIPAFGTREIELTVHLGAAAIRSLLQRMQKAPNPFSSPGISLTLGGKLDLFIPGSVAALQRARAVRLPFRVEIQWPELHINCPAMVNYVNR